MIRPIRLSEAHVRLVQRDVADPGADPRLKHFTDADYEQHIDRILARRPPGPILVFCYGSLIWNPVFTPARIATARALGWQRSFCLRIVRWRASVEQPGLMMQIDRGGACDGVVQQIGAGQELAALHLLWRREMSVKPPGNYARWIDVNADGQRVRAIAFTANRRSPNYVGAQSPELIAERLCRACGHWGSGAQYLQRTVAALEGAGIHDAYLWELQERVAEWIEQRFPQARLA